MAGLTGTARRYCIERTLVHILEYPTVARREAESAGITPDGQVTIIQNDEATLTVTQWSAPPRFFAHDRFVVIALGPAQPTFTALTDLLGGTLTPDAPGGSALGSCDET